MVFYGVFWQAGSVALRQTATVRRPLAGGLIVSYHETFLKFVITYAF